MNNSKGIEDRMIFGFVALCFIVTFVFTCTSDRVVHPNWRPKTINLRHDDINVLMSFRGKLQGSITHGPITGPVLRDKDNRIVYGFTSLEDMITWTVRAPEAAEYRVAVCYTGKLFLSEHFQAFGSGVVAKEETRDPECIVEVSANNTCLQGELQRLTRYNEPEKMAGARQWMEGTLPLKKGENQIMLRFSKLSDHQIAYATKELEEGTLRKSTISLGIKSIELVRPETWTEISKRAKALKADTQWMVDGKYGLFIHWSLLTYPLYGDEIAYKNWEWGVNVFDVEAFADMVEETGASWVIFTTCHGAHYFPAPIKTLDKVLPGRTAQRDLIGEIADALNRKGVRLLIYYNLCGGDETFRKAVGMDDADPSKWFEFLIDFSTEVSQRYGNRIAGWGYIDGSVTAYEYNMAWEPYVRAMKSGNPNAIVGISSHWWGKLTPFGDLQVVDSGGNLFDPLHLALYEEGGRYEGLQSQFNFVMDGAWIPREPYNGVIRRDSHSKGGPVRPFEEYIEYFKKMDHANVPITINMLITQDVTRKQAFVNHKCLELMRQIRRIIWGK